MFRILFSATILFMLSAGLRAQSVLSDEQKTQLKARQEANWAALHLSQEQKPKVEAIDQTYWAGLAELKSSNSSRLSRYRTYKDLKDRHDRQLKEVLTREQYTIYQQQQEERAQTLKNRRSSRP
ncbi:hypothetical protein ACFPMF_04890 [Larkinella bovis]|uniref:DUF4890 domain-containing protein n=1 Tax=Larkinella bovis TaxID=683041 RepID=A0ABW0I8A3_9BACT